MTTSLHDIGQGLVTSCDEAMEQAGTHHVHLIGHSLGGIVVRYAVQRLSLAAVVGTAATVAAPHRGTPVASLARGAVARALRPGSPFLQDLRRDAGDAGVRWVAYSADRDLVVPPDSARLDGHGCSALDVPVYGVGHLGILRAPVFLRSVVQLLLAAEESARRPPAGPVSTEAPVATVA